jgi:hypothetical protein
MLKRMIWCERVCVCAVVPYISVVSRFPFFFFFFSLSFTLFFLFQAKTIQELIQYGYSKYDFMQSKGQR